VHLFGIKSIDITGAKIHQIIGRSVRASVRKFEYRTIIVCILLFIVTEFLDAYLSYHTQLVTDWTLREYPPEVVLFIKQKVKENGEETVIVSKINEQLVTKGLAEGMSQEEKNQVLMEVKRRETLAAESDVPY